MFQTIKGSVRKKLFPNLSLNFVVLECIIKRAVCVLIVHLFINRFADEGPSSNYSLHRHRDQYPLLRCRHVSTHHRIRHLRVRSSRQQRRRNKHPQFLPYRSHWRCVYHIGIIPTRGHRSGNSWSIEEIRSITVHLSTYRIHARNGTSGHGLDLFVTIFQSWIISRYDHAGNVDVA